jgi:hypothetical protein
MKIRLSKLNFTGASADDLPRLLQRLMNGLDDSITPLINSSTAYTNTIFNVSLKAGQDNYVNHLLGYNYTSWFIGKCNEFCRIKESSTINNYKDKVLILNIDVDVTVDLYVL